MAYMTESLLFIVPTWQISTHMFYQTVGKNEINFSTCAIEEGSDLRKVDKYL